MSAKKIPPELHALLQTWSDAGDDSEKIAERLWREHKIEVSSSSVRSLIRKRRSELADVAKSVVRDELRKCLLPALKRLAATERRTYAMAKKARARAAKLREVHEQHPAAVDEDILALKAADRHMKATNLLLHYAGLNQPDKPGAVNAKINDARQALMKRIELLAAAPIPKPEEPPVH